MMILYLFFLKILYKNGVEEKVVGNQNIDPIEYVV